MSRLFRGLVACVMLVSLWPARVRRALLLVVQPDPFRGARPGAGAERAPRPLHHPGDVGIPLHRPDGRRQDRPGPGAGAVDRGDDGAGEEPLIDANFRQWSSLAYATPPDLRVPVDVNLCGRTSRARRAGSSVQREGSRREGGWRDRRFRSDQPGDRGREEGRARLVGPHPRLIEGNTFEGCGRKAVNHKQGLRGNAVWVRNADGVTIRGNTFGPPAPSAPPGAKPLVVEASRNVSVKGNKGVPDEEIKEAPAVMTNDRSGRNK